MKNDVKKEKVEIKGEILSVGEYLDRLNAALKNEKAKVLGEVSGVQEYPGRSYLYFSLKDKKNDSTVKCFMWKNDYRVSGVTLTDGLEIIVSAFPNIYKPNGGMTLQVETVELVGEGALQIVYEKLKKKLDAEGLFAESRKRPLPNFPRRIGVITSKAGAVINDFLNNIGKYGFEIIFVDSKVEGAEAVKDLLAAVEILSQKNLDVLVMMRGGGSLESFQAWSNEALVRALANFPAPTITGIGHDKDAPLLSLVSDKNVSTPTAAAHLLNGSWDSALSSVSLSEEKILSAFASAIGSKRFETEVSGILIEKKFVAIFDTFRRAETTVLSAVQKIDSQIGRLSDFVAMKSKELNSGFANLSGGFKNKIVQYEKIIQLSNPERQLSRGYGIVKRGQKIIRSRQDVSVGDKLDIIVSDGIINTKAI